MTSKAQGKAATNNTSASEVDQALLEQAAREDREGRTEDPESGTVPCAKGSAEGPESDERDTETQEERSARLDLEKEALRPSPADDSLRARMLGLMGLNQYAVLDKGYGVSYERAMFRFAASTAKAVAMAIKGTEYVCANEPYETTFTEDDAANVLLGLSAMLEFGPELTDDVAHAGHVKGAAR